jgi:predicted metal-dependent hydrolase
MRLRVVTAEPGGGVGSVAVGGAGVVTADSPGEVRRETSSSGDEVRVEYRGGFIVTVPAGLTGERRDERIGAALEGWFRERVREDAEFFVRRYAPRLGVEPAGVRVAAQKLLWGSCGWDGVIRLNWQLAFAPRGVLEYVVVHELCHLRERSHGAAFWRLVRGVLPDYEGRKGWLEGEGLAAAHHHAQRPNLGLDLLETVHQVIEGGGVPGEHTGAHFPNRSK